MFYFDSRVHSLKPTIQALWAKDRYQTKPNQSSAVLVVYKFVAF